MKKKDLNVIVNNLNYWVAEVKEWSNEYNEDINGIIDTLEYGISGLEILIDTIIPLEELGVFKK